MKRVAVVGAGSGGVCAAKYLIEAGHDVTVYEAGSYIGGLWKYQNDNGRSQAYKHLCIISPRGKTRFSDFDFRPEASRFPTHEEMYQYMRDYADHFGVTERIRFNSPVRSLEPIEDAPPGTPRWRITFQGPTGEDIADFDDVVVATGHLNEPSHSTFLQEFAGEYLHSGQYRVPDSYVGKRVCVVGTGNSGVDVASDVCTVASRTVLVARSGLKIQPKVVFGLAFPDVTIGLRKPWIPAAIRNRVVSTLVFLAHGDQTRLGFKPPAGRQHPTSSETIVAHIEFGRVKVKPGIAAISGHTVTFDDGTSEDFDVLVAATGYRVHLPFLDGKVVPVIGNRVDLYRRIFPVDRPGLYFLGMLNPLLAYSQVFEAQSKTIVQAVDGRVPLPSADEMVTEIERVRTLAASIYTDSPRHELEDPDTNYPYTMADFRLESAVRARHGGQLPWLLSTKLARKAYARMAGIRVAGV